jgi:hypothetical protein
MYYRKEIASAEAEPSGSVKAKKFLTGCMYCSKWKSSV